MSTVSCTAPDPAPRGEAPDLARVEHLTKSFGRDGARTTVLDDVTLELGRGEICALLGPSGSGKSTFLNLVGGLEPADSGTVVVDGEEVTALAGRRLVAYRRRMLGFVFQFYNLIPSLTARENVAIVTEIARQPMPPEEALALVGLGERLDHFPAQMSGGEQQRVAIARAIAKQPAVLLCDEPTGALDSATGVRVLNALDEVNARLGTCTVVITHNADIARMAHRVLTMGDGRIVAEKVNEQRLKADELRW